MKNLKGFLLNIVYKMYEIIHQQGLIPQSGSGHIRMLNLILSRLVSKQQLKKTTKTKHHQFPSWNLTHHVGQFWNDCTCQPIISWLVDSCVTVMSATLQSGIRAEKNGSWKRKCGREMEEKNLKKESPTLRRRMNSPGSNTTIYIEIYIFRQTSVTQNKITL